MFELLLYWIMFPDYPLVNCPAFLTIFSDLLQVKIELIYFHKRNDQQIRSLKVGGTLGQGRCMNDGDK